MSKSVLYFFSGCTFFIAFVIFSYFVQKQVFTHFDFDTTIQLQNYIPRLFDVPFSLLSLIGSLEVTGVFLLIFLIIRRKVMSGFTAIFLFGVIHIFELYGKTFVRHPGPPSGLLRYDLGFNFPSAYVRPGSSYPSGHAARAFFITIIMGLLVFRSKKFSQKQKIIALCCLAMYDLAMGISRVYLAEHWTSDVIGGMLSGIGLALIAGAFL